MVSWYPGHMVKGEKVFKKNINLIDLVIEILDARIPASSCNEILSNSLGSKEHLIVLNKKDLAEGIITENWLKYFKKKRKVKAIATNALNKESVNKLKELIYKSSNKINSKMKEKGRKPRSIRVMVAGIPNVGKSALINALTGSSSAKTGNKPGVTKGKQWIKIANKIELLDTPGILNPQLKNEEQAYKLAITGAIKNKHYDLETTAYKFIEFVCNTNKQILEKYYQIFINQEYSYDILEKIARKRGCLMSGGKVDRERAAKIILSDYQQGNIGSISLENPPVGVKTT